MSKTPEPPKHYEGPDRRRSWMDKHLTDEPSPVGESSLLAGVLALGESTDHLRIRVEDATRQRVMLTWFAVVAIAFILVQGIYGFTLYRKIERISNDNHTLLVKAETLTNPAAIKQQQDEAESRGQFIIYCLVNIRRHDVDPAVPLDTTCPTSPPASVPDFSK